MAEIPIDPPNNNNATTNNNNIEKKKETDIIHYTKRNRTSVQKQYPITKLLATMDKDKLVELINDLVDANPHLLPEVDAHLPQPKES
ncbi:hypothetical protein BJ944DRAFT_263797 [Cunninghamella echinulata]|nr:hypothetical protein BJ944DRAFT_263797 [Cunninghamella echinulata]